MDWTQLVALGVVGCILAAVGQGLASMVFLGKPKAGSPGWRGVYYVTMWAHPILMGALVGWPAWLPAPHYMGEHRAGRMVWFALAGVLSSTIYDAVLSAVKHKAATGLSLPPPPAGGERPRRPV